ncbi:MAG: nitrogenase reductase, partial [Chloroflexota bacterium]
EIQRKTVVETFPGSAQSEAYTKLAKAILSNKDRYLPTPMQMDDIVHLLYKYQLLLTAA